MKYNFNERIIRKHTDSVKWDKDVPITDKEILPLWVADMDFPCAHAIQEAIHIKAEEQIYGYHLGFTSAYRQAVCSWFKRRFQWSIDPATIFYAGGVVPAIAYLINILSEEGDGIVIQTPVYYPFQQRIQAAHRKVIENPLINQEGRYHIDFQDLEAKMADPHIKGMILCSPHNPVGRVWTKEELLHMIHIARTYGKWIISDEIHCDLIKAGIQHYPLLTLAKGYEDYIAVCSAPSKSFNLAGLQNSNIILPGMKMQAAWKHYVMDTLCLKGPNTFAQVATIAAYTSEDAESWLQQVNAYVDANDAFAVAYLQKHLPKARCSKREGTYLLWLDVTSYCKDEKVLEQKMLAAGLILDEGYLFGQAGKGFERINLACPRSIIEQCVQRICAALT